MDFWVNVDRIHGTLNRIWIMNRDGENVDLITSVTVHDCTRFGNVDFEWLQLSSTATIQMLGRCIETGVCMPAIGKTQHRSVILVLNHPAVDRRRTCIERIRTTAAVRLAAHFSKSGAVRVAARRGGVTAPGIIAGNS